MNCNILDINDAVDTHHIQRESLIRFAAALGYEVVMDLEDRIRRFKQPAFRRVGHEYLSVKTMLSLHNFAAEDMFEYIKTIRDESFSEFLDRPSRSGRNVVELMFAGSCKLVKRIKGQATRKEGLVIQSNVIEFMTMQDYVQYGSGM